MVEVLFIYGFFEPDKKSEAPGKILWFGGEYSYSHTYVMGEIYQEF